MDWTPVISSAGSTVLTGALLYFWQPWAKAYSEEKGKHLARKEDLDEILAEVKAVTAAQKEIESKLSHDLWRQQTIWAQKRELYAHVLTLIHALYDNCRKMKDSARNFNSTEDIDKKQRAIDEYTQQLGVRTDTRASLLKHPGMIQIFGSLDVFAQVAALLVIPAEIPTSGPSQEWANADHDRVARFLTKLVALMKVDLGLEKATADSE